MKWERVESHRLPSWDQNYSHFMEITFFEHQLCLQMKNNLALNLKSTKLARAGSGRTFKEV